jgi:Uma2 family endonuclease
MATEGLFGLNPKSRRKHRPDVAFVSYKKWPKNRRWPSTDPWPVVPDLVVEVISPNDLAESVQGKVKEYLAGGVPLVWVFYPELGWALAYESPTAVRGFTADQELDGGPVLPGFVIPLRQLFAQPDEPADGEANASTEPGN